MRSGEEGVNFLYMGSLFTFPEMGKTEGLTQSRNDDAMHEEAIRALGRAYAKCDRVEFRVMRVDHPSSRGVIQWGRSVPWAFVPFVASW